MKKYNNIYSGAVISLLFLLPGCWPFGQTDKASSMTDKVPHVAAPTQLDTSTVLFSTKDEQGNQVPLITEKTLDDYINAASEANPQVRMILEIMPDAKYDMFFKGLKRNAILREWARRNKVDQKPEYKRDLAMIIDMGKSSLDAQHFQKQLDVKISDSEAKKYYDEHKHEIPGIVVSPGGVETRAVFFESEAKAKEFLTKAQQKGADLGKLAKEYGKEVDDFGGALSERSMVDQKVKDAILNLKKFPSHNLVKVDDKKHGVFHSTSKKKPEYLPFDVQVKGGIKNMLKEQKTAKAFEEAVTKYEKKMGGKENKSYFEAQKKEREAAQKKVEQEMKRASEKAAKETKEIA